MNLFNVIANYTKVFNEIHDVNLMAGFEYKKSSWEGMGIVASQFPYDGSLMNNIGTSEQENRLSARIRELVKWLHSLHV